MKPIIEKRKLSADEFNKYFSLVGNKPLFTTNMSFIHVVKEMATYKLSEIYT
jgi:ADP-glucose pyrophosphorylase